MTAVANAVTGALTGALVSGITKAATAWQKAQDTVTKRRVDFGRAVAKAQVAIVAAGGEDSDCESLIYPLIVEAIGHSVDWATVKTWVTAANVYDSLPSDVRDAFSTEALKTLNGIPATLNEKQEKAGRVDRATFAASVAGTDVRTMREAVKQEKALTGESKSKSKSNASQAEDVVKALGGLVSDETAERFANANVEHDVIVAAVMIGVFLRDKTPKHGIPATLEGVEQFFTPESNAAPSDDGSGADDAS